jgi:hypothetical protein
MINTQNLKRAIVVSEKLEALRAELNSLLGDWSSSGTGGKRRGRPPGGVTIDAAPVKKRKKRKLSPEALEKIRAAQKKRWAAFHKAQKAEK